MVASKTAQSGHFENNTYVSCPVEELARYELMDMVHRPVPPRFFEFFEQQKALPVRVNLDHKVIRPHLRPYLDKYEASYRSYEALRAGFTSFSTALAGTVCNLQFTQLLTGLYVGAPKQLYALWTNNERALPPLDKRDGLGIRVADAKFLR